MARIAAVPGPPRRPVLPAVRASLFITCFNDTLFPETGRAVVALLERLGVEVDFPLEQTCCGQMHFNTGYARGDDPARAALRATFADSEVVVSPSASCVGMVRDYYPRVAELAGDAALAAEVAGAARRACSSSPSCSSTGSASRTSARFFPHRVTYHPTCHSLRMLQRRRPAAAAAAGGQGHRPAWSCPRPSECCGFGGTFAIKNADTSIAMLTDKVRAILDTGAEVCAAPTTPA